MSLCTRSPEKTFADLGLDFPLLECPIDHVPAYEPGAYCCIEQRLVAHAFHLGIGDYVRRDCDTCHAVNFLAADRAANKRCRTCGEVVDFPRTDDGDVFVSFRALRNRYAAITTDTQYGMISVEQAEAGKTRGAPGLDVPGVDRVEEDDGRVAVRLPERHLWEVLTTPNYITWHGECWMFSGDKPMVYLGEWEQHDFDAHTDGNGFELVSELVPDPDIAARIWAAISGPTTLTTYVFRCPDTHRLTLHWDHT